MRLAGTTREATEEDITAAVDDLAKRGAFHGYFAGFLTLAPLFMICRDLTTWQLCIIRGFQGEERVWNPELARTPVDGQAENPLYLGTFQMYGGPTGFAQYARQAFSRGSSASTVSDNLFWSGQIAELRSHRPKVEVKI